MLFSYKVVDFFVDIIYESTLGGYEKVLGISRPEKKKSWIFRLPLPYTGVDYFLGFQLQFGSIFSKSKVNFQPIKSYQAVIEVKRMARGVSLAPRNDHNYILVQYNSKYRAKMG